MVGAAASDFQYCANTRAVLTALRLDLKLGNIVLRPISDIQSNSAATKRALQQQATR